MRSIKDPRHIARILSVIDLYNYFFLRDYAVEKLAVDELQLGNYSAKLKDSIVKGVKEKYTEIDELINKHSSPVKTKDLDLVQLTILRIAVYEGFLSGLVPPKVAVDEAIELTRDFGMEYSVDKIAGILGNLYTNTIKKTPDK
jgi:N utilization substance protein B